MPANGDGQVDDRLRGLDLGDHLVELDAVAGRDLPGDDLRLGETLAEIGQTELSQRHSHQPRSWSEFGRSIARSIPSRIRSMSGRWNFSSFAGGNGMSKPVTRTGACSRL